MSFSPPFFLFLIQQPPISTLFPYTTLFRSSSRQPPPARLCAAARGPARRRPRRDPRRRAPQLPGRSLRRRGPRSEEHTSELQSRQYLVCRLLLEKKNQIQHFTYQNSHLKVL